ncbi:hypothetical protein FH972_015670 [Carpinus fangiana]|uniref:Uncharacterized protein n=1 Tax=Carpinus fangiana TaxID=176857 RepID=A0A5N6RGX4_9ROSI|nr:hypothetical protein FH972_015670 [Carpinus fangiana]
MSLGAPQPRLPPAAQSSLVLCNHSHNAFALHLMAVALQHWVLQSTRRLLLRSQVLATCKLLPSAGAMLLMDLHHPLYIPPVGSPEGLPGDSPTSSSTSATCQYEIFNKSF